MFKAASIRENKEIKIDEIFNTERTGTNGILRNYLVHLKVELKFIFISILYANPG
jgi:hypothetical protein